MAQPATRVVFVFLIFSLLRICFAQQAQSSSISTGPTPTTSCGPSGTNSNESIFSVIAACTPGDGSYGLQPGAVGNDPTSTQGENDAGASGSGNSFVNISTGDQIAIIVVAVVVGVFGIGSALLYYFAKKRQWELREKIRRSARRVATALTPRATQTTFNRKDRGVSRIADDGSPFPSKSPARPKPKAINTSMSEVRQLKPGDMEKGLGMKTSVTATGPGVSSFEMDPESPMTWRKKFFGGGPR